MQVRESPNPNEGGPSREESNERRLTTVRPSLPGLLRLQSAVPGSCGRVGVAVWGGGGRKTWRSRKDEEEIEVSPEETGEGGRKKRFM
jgi:hypothetical protein